MKWVAFILLNVCASIVMASVVDGQNIYLTGKDENNLPIKAFMNNLDAGLALACVNCHRESGLGTSESGTTIPPVSWRFLSKDQPSDKQSRFYSIQNKRPAYNTRLLHRVLTTGINSKGKQVDNLMPQYELSYEQTESLVKYLEKLYPKDDPGVDHETITIATIVDTRLPAKDRAHHLAFIRGLFKMKNAQTRGELKRKKYSPIQKVPQYESYRKWELQVWELPADTGLWKESLDNYYKSQPSFVVLAPQVKNGYSNIQEFCRNQKIPCLFASGTDESVGDYYSFVFRNMAKQRRDYLAKKIRTDNGKLFYIDEDGRLVNIREAQIEIPSVEKETLSALRERFDDICDRDITLILNADKYSAQELYELNCSTKQQLEIRLLGNSAINYTSIAKILESNSNPKICWVTDYDKVLNRNTRKIRVDVLARKFGLSNVDSENLAKNLYAFGLLTDSIHQLAGNFSRMYLMEIIEHMLNSFPNYTYFSSVSGAPYQRAIVGPYKEYCADRRKV